MSQDGSRGMERDRLVDLARGARRVIPGCELAESATQNFVQPTDRAGGVWRVRSTARLKAEVAWIPTLIDEAMAAYASRLQTGHI